MEKIKNINIFLILLLFIGVNLINLISFEFKDVDDCIREVSISNKIIFENNLTECSANNKNIYPQFFIKNYEYEFNTEIKFIFQDIDNSCGAMNIIVYFNEYIIKVTDQKFWKCINCTKNSDGNYIIEDNRLNFYEKNNYTLNISKPLFNFTFTISNNYTEFYIFEVNSAYFSFTDKKYFNIYLYNSSNVVELINFNNTDNFYITENNTLSIDINKYKFQINYINENGFKGKLKAKF